MCYIAFKWHQTKIYILVTSHIDVNVEGKAASDYFLIDITTWQNRGEEGGGKTIWGQGGTWRGALSPRCALQAVGLVLDCSHTQEGAPFLNSYKMSHRPAGGPTMDDDFSHPKKLKIVKEESLSWSHRAVSCSYLLFCPPHSLSLPPFRFAPSTSSTKQLPSRTTRTSRSFF